MTSGSPISGSGSAPGPGAPAAPSNPDSGGVSVTSEPAGAAQQFTDQQIQDAIRAMVDAVKTETNAEYKQAVERVSEARAFWHGVQNGYFSQEDGVWVDAIRQFVPSEDEEVFDYVVNLYRANGEIILAALTQAGVPETQFLPEDPRQPKDLDAAREYSNAVDYIERQPWFNKGKKYIRIQWLGFTDGLWLAYVRHVKDFRFGTIYRDDTRMQSQEIQPAGYQCASCGKFTPGQPGGAICQQCLNPLAAESYQEAVSIDMPKVVGQIPVPKGRELVNIYGVLEARLPKNADEIDECPWAGIEEEVPVASLRAAFTEKSDEIQPGYGVSDAEWAAQAREASKAPTGVTAGGPQNQTVTFGRWWLRAAQFFMVADKAMRAELLKRFPEGCVIELAGNTVLALRPENMDDHLTLEHPCAGDGMYKPGSGDSFIDVQYMSNDAVNLQQEAMGKSAMPPVYRDALLVSAEGQTKRRRPGEDVPVTVPPGKQLSQCVFQPQFKESSSTVRETIEQAMQSGEFLLGAMPALAGGSEENIRTARGYAQAKGQALQRLGIIYGAANRFIGKTRYLMARSLIKSRSDDISYAVPGRQGEAFTSRQVLVGEKEGNCQVYLETSEQMPASWDQKAAAIDKMLNSGNEALLAWITSPQNLEIVAEALGVPELEIPGRNERNRVLRTIMQLLEQQPVMLPAAPIPGQQPEMALPPEPQPSIPLDDFLDDPAFVMQTVREWAISDNGVRESQVNQAGYANVIAYGRAAQKIVVMQQQQALMQQAALAASAPAGKGQEKGSAPPAKPPLPPPGASAPSNASEGPVLQ